MKSPGRWFNIYFLAALLAFAAGCSSSGGLFHHPQLATIRLYLQTGPEASGAGKVLVTREKIPMTIEREPFLDESDLSKAQLIDEPDGTYSIELTFDDHGAMVLDMQTVSEKGRCIVIYSHFPPPGTREGEAPKPGAGGKKTSGWISAVRINGRLSNGSLVFTPDVSRDDAQRIVTGLNNVIKKKDKDF